MSKQHPESPISPLGLIIWALAALFFLYEFFLRTFVGSVAHQVIPDLKLNAETFAVLGSAYYVTYGAMQIPVGILVDKFGVKFIMVCATLICAGSTYLFANSTVFMTALAGRLLMGFGSSFAFICLLVIAATWFPRKYFGFFSGFSQFIGTMGPLLSGGPLIAAMAAYHETWRVALEQISGFGVVLSILVLLVVRKKPRDNSQNLIFLKQEASIMSRMRGLLKNKQAWYIAIYSSTVYISMALLGAIWGTEYLQVQGLSQAAAADVVSLAWLGYAVGCPLIGALSDISKRRKPSLVVCAIMGFIAVASIIYIPLQNAHWVFAILFFILGVSAAGQNVGFAAISEHVNLATRASALGLNNGAITLLAAVVPPLVSYFVVLSSGGNGHVLRPSNFIGAFSVMPLLYMVSFLIAFFFIEETYCKSQKEAVRLVVG